MVNAADDRIKNSTFLFGVPLRTKMNTGSVITTTSLWFLPGFIVILSIWYDQEQIELGYLEIYMVVEL